MKNIDDIAKARFADETEKIKNMKEFQRKQFNNNMINHDKYAQ